eukprot:gene1301-11385_t
MTEKIEQQNYLQNLEQGLTLLQNSIENSNRSKTKIHEILNQFDNRFTVLQLKTDALNDKLDVLKKAHDNVDSTIASVSNVIREYSVLTEAEIRIEEGINGDLTSFLATLDQVSMTLSFFNNHLDYRNAEKQTEGLEKLQRKGIEILENEFKNIMLAESQKEFDPFSYKDKLNEPFHLIKPSTLDVLSKIARRLASKNSANYRKLYKDIHSKIITQILEKIIPLDEKKRSSVTPSNSDAKVTLYQKGSHPFIFYMNFYLKLLEAERKISSAMNLGLQEKAIYVEVIESSVNHFVTSFHNLATKKEVKNKLFVLCDVVVDFEDKYADEYEDLIGSNKLTESIIRLPIDAKNSISLLLKQYIVAINESKVNVSDDGLVHQSTSNSFTFLKRMLDYQDIIENVLKNIYFKNDKEVQENHLEQYIQQILGAVETNIRAKKEEYKDIALSHLFLLNNHNYIMKKLKNPEFTGLSYDNKMISSLKKTCEKDEAAYFQATWGKSLDQLRECNLPTQKLGLFQKNDLKKKFKNFFDHFQNIWELHQKYNIPDIELRENMREKTISTVIPVYQTFQAKYIKSGFTDHPTKYIRFDTNTMKEMIALLYSASTQQ